MTTKPRGMLPLYFILRATERAYWDATDGSLKASRVDEAFRRADKCIHYVHDHRRTPHHFKLAMEYFDHETDVIAEAFFIQKALG